MFKLTNDNYRLKGFILAKLPTKPFKVGPGELSWVYLNGDGSLNELKVPPAYEYKATVLMTAERAKPYIKEIQDFWKAYSPTKKAKSLGYKLNEETGMYEFTFKTNTSFKQKDGTERPVVVRVFRANGSEITKPFHEKQLKAANGSEGIVHGTMAIYDRPSGGGVTLYLTAVQFTKFIEYTGGVDVEAVEEEDDGLDINDGLDVTSQEAPEV